MHKYTVPQFIEVEDKILGPITVRQFVILMVACLLIFIGYKVFMFTAFIFWAFFWLFTVGIVGFLKVNGKPFHFFMLNIIETLKRDSVRVWSKFLTNKEIRYLALYKPEIEKIEKIPQKARWSKSKLAELSLIADTSGAYKGEDSFSKLELKNKKGI